MDVRINERACTFEAVEDGAVVTAITWDWARERGAQFRAELVTVAVDGGGAVHAEPPGGWVEEAIKTKTVKRLPAGLEGWTLSERWKMQGWSPLSASRVTVVVDDSGVATVNGGPAGPGTMSAGPGSYDAVRFTRADGKLVDDSILSPAEETLAFVTL